MWDRAASAQEMSISRDVCSEDGWLICGIDTGDGLGCEKSKLCKFGKSQPDNDDCGVVLSRIAALCNGRPTAATTTLSILRVLGKLAIILSILQSSSTQQSTEERKLFYGIWLGGTVKANTVCSHALKARRYFQ
jgi:hypothetical protein